MLGGADLWVDEDKVGGGGGEGGREERGGRRGKRGRRGCLREKAEGEGREKEGGKR